MNITKRFLTIAIAAISIVLCTSLTGCMKDPKNNNGGGDPEVVPDFSYSTKKPVEIVLQYSTPKGYRVEYEMYTKSPLTLDDFNSYIKDTTIVPFLSGKTDENGRISFKGELPAAVTEIYSFSTGIGVPALMKATVSETGVVSDFKPAQVTKAPETKATSENVGASGTTYWKTYNVTINTPTLPVVTKQIPESDKNLIDLSFPENQDYDVVKSYYKSAIELTGKAKVKIYSLKHGPNNRTNALAYYTYTKETNDLKPQDVNSNLQLVFPELNINTPKEGSGFQLMNGTEEEFEAGTKIGFALFPNITVNNIQTKNAHVLYSNYNIGDWNCYNYPGLIRASVPHMVISLIRQDENGHAIIAIGFEDQPFSSSNGTNKGNFRDNMFIIEVDPATSLPDLPTPPTEVPDHDTEFKSSGILCFEDCWPYAGDYDINDITVAYERTMLYNFKDQKGLVGMKEKFTFLPSNASFTNGFAYQLLGVTQSNISKCTVESNYKCEGQGIDVTAKNDEAVVMLFDNGKSIKTHNNTFYVTTYFKEGASMYGVNPFIIVEKDLTKPNDFLKENRLEVHLPTTAKSTMMEKFVPTSKANNDFWGQYSDKSEPNKKIYYVRAGNYPFALDILWDISKYGDVSQFKVPVDGQNIDKTYPEFTNWVESSGKTNTDWFLRPSL